MGKKTAAEKDRASTDKRSENGGQNATPRDEEIAKKVYEYACDGEGYADICERMEINGMESRNSLAKLYKPELDAGHDFYNDKLKSKMSKLGAEKPGITGDPETIKKALQWGVGGSIHAARQEARDRSAADKARSDADKEKYPVELKKAILDVEKATVEVANLKLTGKKIEAETNNLQPSGTDQVAITDGLQAAFEASVLTMNMPVSQPRGADEG